MKHSVFLTIVLFAGTIFSFGAAAQTPISSSEDTQEAIEGDSELLKGQLPNGLTYYIRHNANPAGCADFYIAHNVGALQEEDSQSGLAHFLEHMAFNGTKHFPGKGIINFLEKEGVRFGYNINAYTNKNETVYNLSSVPLKRDSFIDSVLLVLHDWSCDITCDPVEIDEERGVISEEYRRSDDQRARMAAKQANLLYNGSKHCRRSVIGTLDIINGFPPEEILSFYHKWYHPDLQAIIIVGDFDPKEMEQKVRRTFSDIPAPARPVAKETYEIPALNGPVFKNMTDPEISIRTLKVMIREDLPGKELRNTRYFYKDYYTRLIVTQVISQRLSEKSKQKESPVKSAVAVTSPYGVDFYNTLFTIVPKNDDEFENSLRFIERELRRCREFGFSADEVEAARFQVGKKQRIDKELSEEETTSEAYVKTYIESFLRGFPECSPTSLAEVKRDALNSVKKEDVQSMLSMILDSPERIYSYVINEKEVGKLPDEKMMREIIDSVSKENLEPQFLKFEKIDLGVETGDGKITGQEATKRGSKTIEMWKLSNGAKVWFTPSDAVRSDCHLSMDVYFNTGHRRCSYDAATENFVNGYIARNAGFRGMDALTLKNRPECYGVSWIMSRHTSDKSVIRLQSDGNNAEKAFTIFHILVSEPYLGSEKALSKYKMNELSFLGKKKSGENAFLDEYKNLVYGGNPYVEPNDSASVEKVSMETVREIYSQHFTRFSDMQIFISSDLDKETIKEYVCKYVASLEGEYNQDSRKVGRVEPAYKGKTQKEWHDSETTSPKTLIKFRCKARLGNTPSDRATVDILDYIMSARYLAQIREKRGGTYYVAFISEHFGKKNSLVESMVDFQTRAELKDTLLADTYAILEKMCAEGPGEEEMDAAKKYLVKAHVEKSHKAKDSLVEKNAATEKAVFLGELPDEDYGATVQSVSSKDVRRAARKLLRGDRLVAVYVSEGISHQAP